MAEASNNRKTSWGRRISYGVAIVLTAAIAAVGYHQSRLLPRRISRYVNEHYLRGTNFQFSVDGVSDQAPGSPEVAATRVAAELMKTATTMKIQSQVLRIASEQDLLRLKRIAQSKRASVDDAEDIAFLEARRKRR